MKFAFMTYKLLMEKDEQGVQPLFRLKMSLGVDRQKERRMNKNCWFKRGRNTSVLLVPATPGSKLKK